MVEKIGVTVVDGVSLVDLLQPLHDQLLSPEVIQSVPFFDQ